MTDIFNCALMLNLLMTQGKSIVADIITRRNYNSDDA